MIAVDRRRLRVAAADLRDAVSYPLTGDVRLLGAALATIATYVLLVMSTYPQFTRQLLERDLTDVTYGISVLTREVYLTSGWLGLSLVVVYAVLTGVTGKRESAQPIPFGPFLAIAGWVCMVERDTVLRLFLS